MKYARAYRAPRVACGAFEATALLLTGGVVILCVMVAIKGEDAYFPSTRAWRYVRDLGPNRR